MSILELCISSPELSCLFECQDVLRRSHLSLFKEVLHLSRASSAERVCRDICGNFEEHVPKYLRFWARPDTGSDCPQGALWPYWTECINSLGLWGSDMWIIEGGHAREGFSSNHIHPELWGAKDAAWWTMWFWGPFGKIVLEIKLFGKSWWQLKCLLGRLLNALSCLT